MNARLAILIVCLILVGRAARAEENETPSSNSGNLIAKGIREQIDIIGDKSRSSDERKQACKEMYRLIGKTSPKDEYARAVRQQDMEVLAQVAFGPNLDTDLAYKAWQAQLLLMMSRSNQELVVPRLVVESVLSPIASVRDDAYSWARQGKLRRSDIDRLRKEFEPLIKRADRVTGRFRLLLANYEIDEQALLALSREDHVEIANNALSDLWNLTRNARMVLPASMRLQIRVEKEIDQQTQKRLTREQGSVVAGNRLRVMVMKQRHATIIDAFPLDAADALGEVIVDDDESLRRYGYFLLTYLAKADEDVRAAMAKKGLAEIVERQAQRESSSRAAAAECAKAIVTAHEVRRFHRTGHLIDGGDPAREEWKQSEQRAISLFPELAELLRRP